MWLATTFHCTPKKHNVNPRNAKRIQAATLPPIRGLLAPCAMPQIDFSSRAKRNAAHPCIQPKPHPKSPESSSGGCSAPVEGAAGGSRISRAPDRLLLGPSAMFKRHTTDKNLAWAPMETLFRFTRSEPLGSPAACRGSN